MKSPTLQLGENSPHADMLRGFIVEPSEVKPNRWCSPCCKSRLLESISVSIASANFLKSVNEYSVPTSMIDPALV